MPPATASGAPACAPPAAPVPSGCASAAAGRAPYSVRIAPSTAASEATRGATLHPVRNLTSSMAMTLPGSAMATVSTPPERLSASTRCLRAVAAGIRPTTAASNAKPARSTAGTRCRRPRIATISSSVANPSAATALPSPPPLLLWWSSAAWSCRMRQRARTDQHVSKRCRHPLCPGRTDASFLPRVRRGPRRLLLRRGGGGNTRGAKAGAGRGRRRRGRGGGGLLHEHGGRDHRGPQAIFAACRRLRDVLRVDDAVGQPPYLALLVPARVRIEVQAEGRGQHLGRQILGVVARGILVLAEAVGARKGSRYSVSSRGIATPTVAATCRRGSRVALSDITTNVTAPGLSRRRPSFLARILQPGWEDARHADQVAGGDPRRPQRQLERRELLPVQADAPREEQRLGNESNHGFSHSLPGKLRRGKRRRRDGRAAS